MANTNGNKLTLGHWYRIKDRGEIHTAQYAGRQEFECTVCGFGQHCRVFNLWHDARGDYETWGFGAAHFPEILEDLGEPEEPILDE